MAFLRDSLCGVGVLTLKVLTLESWRDHHCPKTMALVSVRLPLAYAIVWLVGISEPFAREDHRTLVSPLLQMAGLRLGYESHSRPCIYDRLPEKLGHATLNCLRCCLQFGLKKFRV